MPCRCPLQWIWNSKFWWLWVWTPSHKSVSVCKEGAFHPVPRPRDPRPFYHIECHNWAACFSDLLLHLPCQISRGFTPQVRRVRFILMTGFFGASLNFVPNVSASLPQPGFWPSTPHPVRKFSQPRRPSTLKSDLILPPPDSTDCFLLRAFVSVLLCMEPQWHTPSRKQASSQDQGRVQ